MVYLFFLSRKQPFPLQETHKWCTHSAIPVQYVYTMSPRQYTGTLPSFLESLSWWAFLCSVFVGCFLIFSTHKERPQLLVKAYDFGPLLSSRPLSNVGFFPAYHTYYWYDSHLKAHVTLTPVAERLDLFESLSHHYGVYLYLWGTTSWNKIVLDYVFP